MKNTLIFAFFLSVFINSSCNEVGNKNTETSESITENKLIEIPDFTKSFEGSINASYEIVMTLTKNTNNLNGTYTYKSQGAPVKLSGTIDPHGNLTINEFSEKGNMTGIFKGQLNGKNIIGHWTKPDGSKTMPFSISETNISETIIVKPKSNNSDNNLSWNGTYEDEFGSTLKIKGPDSDGSVQFELLQVSANCTGDINGTASLSNSNVANFSQKEDKCHLNFTFHPGSIQVKEYDCGNYRGASCGTFDGWYYSKKNN